MTRQIQVEVPAREEIARMRDTTNTLREHVKMKTSRLVKLEKSSVSRRSKPPRSSNTPKDFPLPEWLRTAKRGGIRGQKPVRGGTKTSGAYKAGANGVHVFRLVDLKVAPNAGGTARKGNYYADTKAVVIEGKQIMVGLAHEKAGMGSRPHHHPNDQINLVLKGTMRCKIGDGPEVLVPTGSVVYLPADVVHETGATADEDVIFYVCKDLAWGITGIPIDKQVSGARSGIGAAKKEPNR